MCGFACSKGSNAALKTESDPRIILYNFLLLGSEVAFPVSFNAIYASISVLYCIHLLVSWGLLCFPSPSCWEKGNSEKFLAEAMWVPMLSSSVGLHSMN